MMLTWDDIKLYFLICMAVNAVICGLGASAIAESKGKASGTWFFYGLLGGPLAVMIIGFIEKETTAASWERASTKTTERGDDEARVRCPDCAELIRKEAKICHFCGRQMVKPAPLSAPMPPPPSAEAQLREAHRFLSNGDPKAALAAYQAITREFPDFTDAWRCISTLASADMKTREEARHEVARLSQG